jgi:hypothetical protein
MPHLRRSRGEEFVGTLNLLLNGAQVFLCARILRIDMKIEAVNASLNGA